MPLQQLNHLANYLQRSETDQMELTTCPHVHFPNQYKTQYSPSIVPHKFTCLNDNAIHLSSNVLLANERGLLFMNVPDVRAGLSLTFALAMSNGLPRTRM